MDEDNKIIGGYILISRKILDSDIFKKPPLYAKVWLYLLSMAQHRDYKHLKRGQLLTNIPAIQEACSYKIGYRLVKPTKDEVFKIIKWLRSPDTNNTSMISTKRVTHGMLITIQNYDTYQRPQNYETNQKNNTKEEVKEKSTPSDNKIIEMKSNKHSGEVGNIIEHLNKKANTNYRKSNKNTISLIESRIKEGYSENDFIRVIDCKVAEWKNTQMDKYIRPETLFGKKFESYVVNANKYSNKDNGSKELKHGVLSEL